MYAFAGFLLIIVLFIGVGYLAFYGIIALMAIIFSIKGIIEDMERR